MSVGEFSNQINQQTIRLLGKCEKDNLLDLS